MPHHLTINSLFGRKLYELRIRRGLTLRALAAKAHYSHTQIWELEKGTRQPTAEAAACLDRALDAGGELAVLGVAEQSPSATAVAPDSLADTVDTVADLGWGNMLRAAPTYGLPAVAAGDLIGPAATMTATGRIDPATVTGLADVAVQYRLAYQAVPSSALLPAAMAHLNLVISARPRHQPESARKTLLTTVGEMAALAAALLCLDASQRRAAAPYLDLAWTIARTVNDIELQAVVLCGRSFAISYGTGDHRAGLDYADLARDVAGSGACPQTRAWVAAVASERAAAVGDLDGCQIRLDESRAALDAPGDQTDVWRGIGGFNAGKLRAYEGGNLVRLRRFDDARIILDEALTGLDDTMHRHRATALVDRAEAHLGAGDLDAACNDAGEALQLVTRVQHTGNLDRITDLTARAMFAGARAARSLRRDVELTRADHGLPLRSEHR